MLREAAGDRGRVLGDGLQLRRRRAEPRHAVRQAEADRRAREGREHSRRGSRRARCGGPLGVHHRRASSSRSCRRAIRASARSAASSSSCSTRAAATIEQPGANVTQRRDRGQGNQSPDLRGLFASFTRERSAAGRRHRPREAEGARDAASRGQRRPAGVPRVAVRERLRLQQPRVSRVRAGRSAVPRDAAGDLRAVLRARGTRRDGAARQRGAACGRPPRRR